MGIGSIIAKAAKSAAKAIQGASTSKILSDAKRVVKAAPDFIFGTGSDAGAKAMKATKGSIFTKLKAGAKAVVKHAEKQSVRGNFAKRVFIDLKTLPEGLYEGFKVGQRAAKIANKSFLGKLGGGLKGMGKAIGKRMPMIGSVVATVFEIPNIYEATKNEGLGTGLKETGKAVVRLAGGAAGSMIGALCGPVGGVIGFCLGEYLAGLLTGTSYSEKKEFLAEYGYDENIIKQIKDRGYSFDEIYKEVKAAVKEAEKNPQAQPEDGTQPVQEEQVPGQTPANPSQETPAVTLPGETGEAVPYSKEETALLKQLGLSDNDIQVLQGAGYSFNDAVALVSNIKNTDTTTTDTTSADTGKTNQNPDYIDPFVLPFPTMGSAYTGGTGWGTGFGTNWNTGFGTSYMSPYGGYNSGTYSNPYANDTYYNMLLSNIGMGTTSNPFLSGTQLNQQAQQTSQNQVFDNMYYKNGRLGYSA